MIAFYTLLGMTLVAAMLPHHVSSYSQQVNFYIPSKFDGTHLARKPPRPPTYPPRDFEREELFLQETNELVNELKQNPPPLPMTNNPYAILGLDWLKPPSDIAEIHKAYKLMAKRYHPDLILHADATQEEHLQANRNFARINAAYEQLKAKEAEEILDYVVYVDGRKVRRHVTIKSESYYKDPMRPNYERIIAMSKYREKYPRKKLWFERKHSYEPRHNGEWEP